MPQSSGFEPTERELEVLRVLWERGPSTVREVQQALSAEAGKEVGRTTALKFLQIMLDKHLVTRDESQHSHVYSAAESKAVVEKQLVASFMQRVFAGSAMNLVARALDVKVAGAEELAEIRRLIDEAGDEL